MKIKKFVYCSVLLSIIMISCQDNRTPIQLTIGQHADISYDGAYVAIDGFFTASGFLVFCDDSSCRMLIAADISDPDISITGDIRHYGKKNSMKPIEDDFLVEDLILYDNEKEIIVYGEPARFIGEARVYESEADESGYGFMLYVDKIIKLDINEAILP